MGIALSSYILAEDNGPAAREAERGSAREYREVADAALVERAQSGEIRAFEELVRRYRNDVFALSHHFLHDREDAWDVSQEVFIKAHRSLKRFRGDAAFKTWLLRIAANQCKDFLKKRRLQTVSLNNEEYNFEGRAAASDTPARSAEASEVENAILEVVEALPHKHRTTFILREFEGLAYQEMAEVMNCSLGTVMSRLHHARAKVRAGLEAMGITRSDIHETA